MGETSYSKHVDGENGIFVRQEKAMRQQPSSREERPVRSGRLRSALKSTAQMCVAAVACALWIGLAIPGLQLLPGVGDLANASVAISLQSALLGIDDTSAQPTSVSVRAALHALGLSPTQQLLPSDLLRLRGMSASGSLTTSRGRFIK